MLADLEKAQKLLGELIADWDNRTPEDLADVCSCPQRKCSCPSSSRDSRVEDCWEIRDIFRDLIKDLRQAHEDAYRARIDGLRLEELRQYGMSNA